MPDSAQDILFVGEYGGDVIGGWADEGEVVVQAQVTPLEP